MVAAAPCGGGDPERVIVRRPDATTGEVLDCRLLYTSVKAKHEVGDPERDASDGGAALPREPSCGAVSKSSWPWIERGPRFVHMVPARAGVAMITVSLHSGHLPPLRPHKRRATSKARSPEGLPSAAGAVKSRAPQAEGGTSRYVSIWHTHRMTWNPETAP